MNKQSLILLSSVIVIIFLNIITLGAILSKEEPTKIGEAKIITKYICSDGTEVLDKNQCPKTVTSNLGFTTSVVTTSVSTIPLSNIITYDQELSDTIKSMKILDSVRENWDADADQDGLRITFELRDERGHKIKFENISLTTKIELVDEKGHSVYSQLRVINSSEECGEDGILVSFEDIAKSSERMGMAFVYILLPPPYKEIADTKMTRLTPCTSYYCPEILL